MVYRPPGMGPPGQITQPGFPSEQPSYAERSAQGAYIRTNRDNQGAWTNYLEALRRVPGSNPQKNTYETPEDRANRPRPLPAGPRARDTGIPVPTRSGRSASIGATQGPAIGGRPTAPVIGGSPIGATPAGRYGAAQESRAGTPQANYAAGLRTYGASGRSAPNVGAVRNKGGYNERDARIAARNGRANLASGDEISRVRLLGG